MTNDIEAVRREAERLARLNLGQNTSGMPSPLREAADAERARQERLKQQG